MTEPSEAVEPSPTIPDDAQIHARFVQKSDDAIGLLAYALHRRALLAFHTEFAQTMARAPDPAEEAAFLVGEISGPRLASYRNEASLLITPAAATPVAGKRKARWPFFGLWVDAPMAPSGEPEKINWRGLMLRLAILLASVITTAILIRILVVKA